MTVSAQTHLRQGVQAARPLASVHCRYRTCVLKCGVLGTARTFDRIRLREIRTLSMSPFINTRYIGEPMRNSPAPKTGTAGGT